VSLIVAFRHCAKVWRLTIPVCLLAVICTPAAFAQKTLLLTGFHLFLGLGTQIWMHSPSPDQEEALLRDLNIVDLRTAFGPKIEPGQIGDARSVEEIGRALLRVAQPLDSAIAEKFRDRLQRVGARLHFISWGMPTVWLADSAPGHKVANPAHIQDYVNLVTAELLWNRNLGLVPQGIELTNEPGAPWSTQYVPAEYGTLVASARRTFNQYGLSQVDIEGPGTGVSNLRRYMDAVVSLGHEKTIDLITLHEYNRTAGQPWTAPGDLASLVQALAHGRNLVFSEFSDDEPRWSRHLYTGGPDHRGQVNGAASFDFGISALGDGLMLLNAGANGAWVWELQDQPWAKGYYGLLDVNGNRKPVAEVFRVAFGDVVPGCLIGGVTDQETGLIATEFDSSSALHLLIMNLSDSVRDVRLALGKKASEHAQISHLAYADRDGIAVRPNLSFTVLMGIFSGRVPPRSVLSIHMQ
jgi:hypothetical protein